MGRSQKHHFKSSKFIVEVKYPFNLFGSTMDKAILEAAGRNSGATSTWDNKRCISFHYLDENEAVGIMSRVMGLGIEGLSTNSYEDECDDLDGGGDW